MIEPSSARKRGGRPRIEVPSETDVHVGSRLKQRRLLLGLSQDRLAKEIGLTFQQVQKYERGTNRIGASRLHDIARVLDVPVGYFFDHMASATAQPGMGEREQDRFTGPDPFGKRETLELIRVYYRIPNAALRKKVLDMMKAMAVAPERLDNSD